MRKIDGGYKFFDTKREEVKIEEPEKRENP
jgi:hypothetical protein